MNKNAIILLSGGLDSLASLALSQDIYNIKKALFFNYGQRAYDKELSAVKKICKYYDISLEIVDLKWLGGVSESLLNNEKNEISQDSGKYWVPNRNGLFVNIGACYAEALGCDAVIIGANKTEAGSFSDNSKDFIDRVNNLFEYSTQNGVRLYAPLINMTKQEIIANAIKRSVPLNLVWSCYYDGEKHCGKCPSCLLLKRALADNGCEDLKNLLF